MLQGKTRTKNANKKNEKLNIVEEFKLVSRRFVCIAVTRLKFKFLSNNCSRFALVTNRQEKLFTTRQGKWLDIVP